MSQTSSLHIPCDVDGSISKKETKKLLQYNITYINKMKHLPHNQKKIPQSVALQVPYSHSHPKDQDRQ